MNEYVNDIVMESNEDEIDFISYDSIEDIKKCLSCDKPECTNCLRFINGV